MSDLSPAQSPAAKKHKLANESAPNVDVVATAAENEKEDDAIPSKEKENVYSGLKVVLENDERVKDPVAHATVVSKETKDSAGNSASARKTAAAVPPTGTSDSEAGTILSVSRTPLGPVASNANVVSTATCQSQPQDSAAAQGDKVKAKTDSELVGSLSVQKNEVGPPTSESDTNSESQSRSTLPRTPLSPAENNSNVASVAPDATTSTTRQAPAQAARGVKTKANRKVPPVIWEHLTIWPERRQRQESPSKVSSVEEKEDLCRRLSE